MKKWYIVTIVIFVLGIAIGGGLEHKRFAKSMETFEYKSEVPVRLTITDQEMGAKPQLIELMKNYGQITEDSKSMEPEYHEIKERALLEILPQGCHIVRFVKDDEDIRVAYEVDGLYYFLCYINSEVEKTVDLKYKNGKYSVTNSNNKNIEYMRVD